MLLNQQLFLRRIFGAEVGDFIGTGGAYLRPSPDKEPTLRPRGFVRSGIRLGYLNDFLGLVFWLCYDGL